MKMSAKKDEVQAKVAAVKIERKALSFFSMRNVRSFRKERKTSTSLGSPAASSTTSFSSSLCSILNLEPVRLRCYSRKLGKRNKDGALEWCSESWPGARSSA